MEAPDELQAGPTSRVAEREEVSRDIRYEDGAVGADRGGALDIRLRIAGVRCLDRGGIEGPEELGLPRADEWAATRVLGVHLIHDFGGLTRVRGRRGAASGGRRRDHDDLRRRAT